MPRIELITEIAAPPARCFDVSLSVDFHIASTVATGEQAIAGKTSGILGLGESVTWRAKHFGIWQELTVAITRFERPHHFQDAMQEGTFASMVHDHHFDGDDDRTTMRDVFEYRSPLGPLGRLADWLMVERHMRELLIERNRVLKAALESDDWRRFVVDVHSPGAAAPEASSSADAGQARERDPRG